MPIWPRQQLQQDGIVQESLREDKPIGFTLESASAVILVLNKFLHDPANYGMKYEILSAHDIAEAANKVDLDKMDEQKHKKEKTMKKNQEENRFMLAAYQHILSALNKCKNMATLMTTVLELPTATKSLNDKLEKRVREMFLALATNFTRLKTKLITAKNEVYNFKK